MTNLTDHSKKRLKERSGLNKKSKQRIADKVYELGIKHCEVKGSLKKWVDKQFLYNYTATNIRLYGDKCYLFDKEKTLITVIQIPNELKKFLKYVDKCK